MDVQQIILGTQEALTARRVFGEPIHVGEVTLIPAASVRGGAGGGGRTDDRGGAGFGLRARLRIILGGQLVAITALLTCAPVIRGWLSRRGR